MKRYLKLKNSRYRKTNNETNDCAVIAISILTRSTYQQAHIACKEHNRLARKGMYTSDILMAIESLGFKLTTVNKLIQKNGSKYTSKTINKKLKRGYYLCLHNGHAFTVVNGSVECSFADRKFVIIAAWKVTRI